ncbi:MAG: nuclear transport factor 2 family protein [Anaerolineales bacterium]|jgi:hypothetical protein|nr:nuclear transport factor 2 family protein [Anaerolineales bacterium]
MNPTEQVRLVLQKFQDYYTRRDPAWLDSFLELLATDDLEVIGTNGVRPGKDEWYLGREAAREIFLGDWQSWGDLRLDVPGARIRVNGKIAWLSATATVSMTIRAEQNYADFLAFIQKHLETSPASAEEKLLYILRGGSNTLYELRRGEQFVWPLRFTAVLALHGGEWKFQQMQFSFPTTYFPDVRILE